MRTIEIVFPILVGGAHAAAGDHLEVGRDVDSDTADTLVRHGRAIEVDPEDGDDAIKADPVADDLHPLTVAQLRAVAQHEEVDLGAATRRADVLAVIREVRAGRAA